MKHKDIIVFDGKEAIGEFDTREDAIKYILSLPKYKLTKSTLSVVIVKETYNWNNWQQ